jgi:putative transcriptional regulator
MRTAAAADETDWKRLSEMSDEEAYQNALSDPDNPPLDEGRLAGMRRSSRARVIRRALGMSRAEFSQKFRIPFETLQEWEALRATPDPTSDAYLTVIANDSQAVLNALHPASAA